MRLLSGKQSQQLNNLEQHKILLKRGQLAAQSAGVEIALHYNQLLVIRVLHHVYVPSRRLALFSPYIQGWWTSREWWTDLPSITSLSHNGPLAV